MRAKSIKVIKSPVSPLKKGIEVSSRMELMTISVLMPNGMIITSPDQFPDWSEFDDFYEVTEAPSTQDTD